MSQGWEARAEEWLAWARTPDHDAYWGYRGAFFDLLPPPEGRALEVGCGEGRVCRDLAERGYRPTGLDASPTLVAAASERDPTGEYALGEAEALPFAKAAFELVVAYKARLGPQPPPRGTNVCPRSPPREQPTVFSMSGSLPAAADGQLGGAALAM